MHPPALDASLVLLPAVDARAALAGRAVRFRVLRPPFVALGLGDLRVLRVSETDGTTEVVAGYERYERWPPVPDRP